MLELKDLLKQVRPMHGSQVEVAEKLGIRSQQLSQYENGIRNPKLAFYRKWKTAFNQDLHVMLDEANVSQGTEKPTPVLNEAAIRPTTPKVSDAIRTVVEEGTEYYLIPKVIFQQKYMLVAEDQFNQDKSAFNKILGLLEKELDKKEGLAAKPHSAKDTK